MLTENLISSKQLIAELFSDYNIEGTDWVTKVNRHIARGMELMQLDGYFKRTFRKANIVNGTCPLPCDNKNLIAVLTVVNGLLLRVPLESNHYIGREFNDVVVYDDCKASVDFNTIVTNLEDRPIYILYYSMPLDCDGYPLIVNNPFVLDALPFYIIKKLGYSGYKHPVISRQEANDEWERLSARARNDVNFPTIEDMERLSNMITDPYYVYTPDPNFQVLGLDENTDGIFLRQLHKE